MNRNRNLKSSFSLLRMLGLALALVPFLDLHAEEPNDDLQWFKGNLHTHTLWSDGNDFPEMAAKWYVDHGYNFLALTDHNILSEGEKWVKYSLVESRGGKDVLKKYLEAYGDDWVVTRGESGTDSHEIRLKTLEQFRPTVEKTGQFLMIQAEEISDRSQGKPIHMNATNLATVISPVGGETPRQAMENNLRAVQQQARRIGKPIMLHLNHPNFGYAVTAEDIAAVVQERFFEVYNGHPGVNQLGDDTHVSIERMWDIANTLRLSQLNGEVLYGVATDDTHNYHGRGGSRMGRGWVMVRASDLSPESLINAMNRGDFYSSSGVTLESTSFNKKKGVLSVKVKPEEGVNYRIEFIGTRVKYDRTVKPRKDKDGNNLAVTRQYSADVGATLKTVEGPSASYKLAGDEIYVRAVVHSDKPHVDASFAGQVQQAWTQPVVITK